MGLSATQARFLMLTAQKSNVEYQGQQINQARTVLANQSANLYAKLSALKVPVPPTTYTYVINPITKSDVSIDWSNPNAWPLSSSKKDDFDIYYSSNQIEPCDFNIPYYVKTVDGKQWKQKSYDKDGNIVYGDPIDELPESGLYAYEVKGDNDTSAILMHVDEGADYTYDAKTNIFTPKKDEKGDEITLPNYLQAYDAAQAQYELYSIPSHNPVTVKDKDGADTTGYNQSATIAANTAQYEAAMAQYQRDKAAYDEACAKINAQTEEIHETDKTLELQLKQLDTEQNAIQTEYEALQKVIQKNIENTYKTFGNA